MQEGKQVVWFSEVGKEDIPLVGGKGANLGEMTKAGLPVPQGFIVTSQAYFDFVIENGLDKFIQKETANLDPEDSKKLNQIALSLQKSVKEFELPADLVRAIETAYSEMDEGPVAVRSSATAEDLPDASFAGQQATFLNIEGKERLIKAIRECWASLFEARAIYYRTVNKFDHMKVGIAVPVQKMVQSEISGIMFTVDPVTEDTSKITIDAGLGLGEAIVSGSVTPDHYVVNKEDFKIVSKEIGAQEWQIIRDSSQGAENENVHKNLTPEQQKNPKMTDEQIVALAKIGKQVEDHYGKPQDTEWAFEGGSFYMVQARPVTTLGEKKANEQPEVATEPKENKSLVDSPAIELSKAEVLLSGAAASVGLRSGPVKIIHKPSEIDKVLEGDVLVTEMTSPDYVPAMRRAAAIVTDTGGRTSHAAIVSRELGIPCVVGTGTATHVLKTGMVVSVDGAQGKIYKGKVGSVEIDKPMATATSVNYRETVPITATKVYLNLAEPEKAEEYSQLPVDGVGLLRAEFIIAGIGEHPRAMIDGGRSREYVQKLSAGIAVIAQAFAPRPVVYRFTDFKTNEYRSLKGGDKYEEQENNPMIGYRGASRYISEPDEFALEIEAIKQVRDAMDLKNLHVMIPFVRTVDEFRKVRTLMHNNGLKQAPDFKLWIMVEVPSTVLELEEYIKEGIDGVSIGSNDLTQLTLGIDRDSAKLASEFDERYPAVLNSILHVVRTCRKHNITCSICGQAPSVYPEITEAMVKAGTTSVSVAPDVAISTRKLIASVEKKILLAKAIE